MRSTLTAIIAILLLTVTLRAEPRPQYRAFWIETFHTPLATHTDIDRIVDAAVKANANAVFVQVRQRGDSWYLDTAEPLTESPGVGEPAHDGAWTFDPFKYLITEAHAHGIEVHAFVIVGAVHRENTPPHDPQHVFLQHIWDTSANAPYHGARQWATRSLPHNAAGTTFDGQRYGLEWYIDLGHPDAVAYTIDVLMKLVDDYDIDGLHLDRIRYPEAPLDRNGGSNVGYNETSVARFKARYGDRATYYTADDVGKKIGGRVIRNGDAGYPRTNDRLWSEWRREQVTNFTRRLYLNAIAHKPKIKISAALIAFGTGPRANGGFEHTEAYYHVFQDWQTWARQGLLDIVTPMTYKREHIAAERAQFDDWVSFTTAVAHAGGRFAMPGIGAYLNAVDGTLRQARRAGETADGVIFFAVGDTTPNTTSRNSTNAAVAHQPKQTNEAFFSALRGSLFGQMTAPPPMTWKSAPTTGYVMGFARDANGAGLDGTLLHLDAVPSVHSHTLDMAVVPPAPAAVTDGGGFYGFVGVPPGDYRIGDCTVRVVAGAVARVDLPCAAASATAPRKEVSS